MKINISHSNLINFDCSAFSTDDERAVLCSISQLNISFNNIVSLCDLVLLSGLTVLDVSHNNVASFVGLPLSLRKLDASFNALTSLDGLSQHSSLEVLIVSHNQITNIQGISASVRIVDVSSNKLSSFLGLEKCTALEELQAQRNIIRHVEELALINSFHSLKRLELADNPIMASEQRVAALHALLPPLLCLADLSSRPAAGELAAASFLNTAKAQNTTNNSDTLSTNTVTIAEDEPTTDVDIPSCVMSGTPSFLHSTADTNSVITREARSVTQEPRQDSVLETDILGGLANSTERVALPALEHLQSELGDYCKMCLSYKEKNASLRLKLRQLQLTNMLQERTNAMLLEENRELKVMLAEGPSRRQKALLSAKLNWGDSMNDDSGVETQISSIEDAASFFYKGMKKPEEHDELQGNSCCHHVGVLLNDKAKFCNETRSLASFLMTFVPKRTAMTTDEALISGRFSTPGFLSDSSCDRTASSPCAGGTGCSQINGNTDLKHSKEKKIGQKRSVSFGGLAYHSSS